MRTDLIIMLLVALVSAGCAGGSIASAGTTPDINSIQGLPLTEENLVGMWELTNVTNNVEVTGIVRIYGFNDGWIRGTVVYACTNCTVITGQVYELTLRIEGNKIISKLGNMEYKLVSEDYIVGEGWTKGRSKLIPIQGEWRRVSRDPTALK